MDINDGRQPHRPKRCEKFDESRRDKMVEVVWLMVSKAEAVEYKKFKDNYRNIN